MGAAWALNQTHEIALYEAQERLGGHANTVTAPGGQPVDTGFLVFNEATYPNLLALFAHLQVPFERSDMSLSVSIDEGAVEYGCMSWGERLAQPSNLLRPRFYAMWMDLLRFYREAPKVMDQAAGMSLGEYLSRHGYGAAFVEDHLLPMGSAIWSATYQDILDFPVQSFVRFCINHGLLKTKDRPQWFTVSGGSREYVRRLTAPYSGSIRRSSPVVAVRREKGGQVRVITGDGQSDLFDHVVFGSHADETLAMIQNPHADEAAVLGAFRYSHNDTWLHQDRRLMPRRRKAWSSWNYLARKTQPLKADLAVSYWINRLQNIDNGQDYFVTLNPPFEPQETTVLGRFSYAHPQYDAAAVAAQGRVRQIQGTDRLWFCGAWCGWGFHEDGLSSGLAVARALGGVVPWDVEDVSIAGPNATPDGPRALTATWPCSSPANPNLRQAA